jgi:asparagine synthase (glutamine-hydrolysing)
VCGIAGYVGSLGGQPALERALATMTHRGPDDAGITQRRPSPSESGPVVALGSRRLAIIDPTAAGHQPMITPDGRLALVYNGEIYNHVELRAELERAGYAFRTHSDTEVLLAAWLHWGPSALDKLVGMFAFAVHDRDAGRLFLVRDWFGIKPLYYARWHGGVAFASEIGALLEFPGIDRRLDPQRLHRFLTSMTSDHGSGTMLAAVRQVPAASFVSIDVGSRVVAEPIRYWHLDLARRSDLSLDEAATRLHELFTDSVRLHLRSDVPIGFALSGGIDSSAVVMVARQLLGATSALHTFSYVNDHPIVSERRYSEHVAQAARSIADPFTIDPEELTASFADLIDAQGEPFPDPVIFAQYRMFARARDAGVKVVLTGEGADELFAGYDRFAPVRLASLLRTGRWISGARLLRHATHAGATPSRLLRAAAGTVAPGPLRRAIRLVRGNDSGEGWMRTAWFVKRCGDSGALQQRRAEHTLHESLVASIEHVTLPALLRYQDRNAMAWSVENRVPFLTRPLVEFALSLPAEYLLTATGIRKAVFRVAMEGIVPKTVLDRRGKIGFSTPAPHWLAEIAPWIELRLPAACDLPFLDGGALRREWDAVRTHYSWRGARMVWRCLCVAEWIERRAVALD